jgi:hypothetical protein
MLSEALRRLGLRTGFSTTQILETLILQMTYDELEQIMTQIAERLESLKPTL